MQEEELIMILGVCFLGAVMVIVPFLLHHQRKMAEIVHSKSHVADELSKRLDLLTDAVFQLATRVEHATSLRGPVAPPAPESVREMVPNRNGG